MRKNLTYKVLAAVLTLSAANWAVPANVLAGEIDTDGKYIVTDDGETISYSYNGVYGNGHSFTINGGTIYGDVFGVGEDDYSGDVSGGNVSINGNAEITGTVYGGYSATGEAYNNTVNISGGTIGSDSRSAYVYGGMSYSDEAHHNTVNISGGTIGSDSRSAYVYGGWSDSGSANNNIVNISDGTVTGNIYGGYEYYNGTANDNNIIISGSANIENASLYGRNSDAHGTGNTLTIDGWSGRTNSVKNFNDIAFKNIDWNNNESILTITNQNNYTSDLTNTTIDTINIAGGSNINVGESMTLIKSENNTNLGLTEGNVTDTFTAGVAREGLGSTSIDGNGNVTFKVNSIKLSSQAVSAAQTRAASAAFVNQGTDLISDSLYHKA